ncbi:MAG TPA: RNA 2',3'-cyclic phosphodiesterase [bacterium]|nr:RNA 2',3'-cyclic phosphodiesterase [bacterium]
MNGSHRIFVAVELEAPLRQAITDLERRLEDAGARLRWVKPENLHFTLRFLGHISEAQLNRVKTATREAAQGVAPFRISLGGLGAFPNARRPQVIWVGIGEGGDTLRDLAARLDDTLARQRFPKEPRGFQPHLTLARVKEPRLSGDIGPVLGRFERVEVGEQEVRSLVVMESLLRPQGAIYTQVEEVTLSPYEK